MSYISFTKVTYLRIELLESKWTEEGIVEQRFADRDMEILKKFDHLIDHTEVIALLLL